MPATVVDEITPVRKPSLVSMPELITASLAANIAKYELRFKSGELSFTKSIKSAFDNLTSPAKNSSL